MRIVVALGGNALLKRGEPQTTEVQRRNVRVAAEALAPIAKKHELVITHGNGPQVGLLALQDAAYEPDENAPLDVLGAQTEGAIGYMIEQELGNLLPFKVPFATMLTMVEVDGDDPAFRNPTKFVGPVYEKAEAERLAREKGFSIKADGTKWRRVVPSPLPKRIFEIRPIKWLLDKGTILICAGGGGIPTMYEKGKKRKLIGVEAVIDKDLCSELLARELEADLFIMLTDADAVYLDWGKSTQRALRHTSKKELAGTKFAAGSMGPKVDAACHFAETTGKLAAIGALADLGKIIAGKAGTTVHPSNKKEKARGKGQKEERQGQKGKKGQKGR
jgi:carbamate kinase